MTEETTPERIMREAEERAAAARNQRRQAAAEDYVFDKAQEAFWDTIDGTLHGEKSVDASIPLERWRVEVRERPRSAPIERMIPPSRDIMRVENDLFVESSTWWPGRPRIVNDFLITPDGPRPSPGRRAFNTFEPAPTVDLNAREPTSWLLHVRRLWPDPNDHEFFFDYCAHMVQRPEEKCNTGIVLSGKQGIGKDAALLPVKLAVGAWNCKNIDPDDLFSGFRPWLQAVMLVIDEVRPSKDEFHASSMYNLLKPLVAAPPDVLPLNDKFAKLRYVVNVMRVFLTTNDWMSMYIPAEDRRMFIMHSEKEKGWHIEAGVPDYFAWYWDWIQNGGAAQVAGWLARRDISAFKPKREAPRTEAWQAIVGSWSTTPDDGLVEAIEALGAPDVIFPADLLAAAFDGRDEIQSMLKTPRKITHRMLREGYVVVTPPGGERWRFKNKETNRDIQCKMAFVKMKSFTGEHGAARARDAIREHGKDLAAQRVSLRPIQGGKG